MSDIGSGIVGSFNQANLASRLSEKEKARARRAEQDRVGDARRRSILNQEEVDKAQTLRGQRVEPDKEREHGRQARDQYEAHEQFSQDSSGNRGGEEKERSDGENPPDRKGPPETESGQLIDVEV